MNKEEYLTKVLSLTVRETVQTILETKELSQEFFARSDQKDIEKELDKISSNVTTLFVTKLKQGGFLEEGKDISEAEFQELLRATLKEYLGGQSEHPSE
jgi:hypothetical protein